MSVRQTAKYSYSCRTSLSSDPSIGVQTRCLKDQPTPIHSGQPPVAEPLVAIETADVTLMNDDLSRVADFMLMSRAVLRRIKTQYLLLHRLQRGRSMSIAGQLWDAYTSCRGNLPGGGCISVVIRPCCCGPNLANNRSLIAAGRTTLTRHRPPLYAVLEHVRPFPYPVHLDQGSSGTGCFISYRTGISWFSKPSRLIMSLSGSTRDVRAKP